MKGTQENILVVKTPKKKKKEERKREKQIEGIEQTLNYFCFPKIVIFRRLMMQQDEVKAH